MSILIVPLLFLHLAAAPLNTDDAWGSPAPPSDSSSSNDPFGDGASKSSDPWGAPSNATSNGTGKSNSTLCLNAQLCDPTIIHESKNSSSALYSAIKGLTLIKSM